MSGVNVSARIPPREFAIVAYLAKLTDASNAEVGKYALMRLAGFKHEEAREQIVAMRKPPSIESDDKVFGFQVQKEWLDSARRNVPEMSSNTSQLIRYSLARLGTDEEDARELAVRKMGAKDPEKIWQGRRKNTEAVA